MSATATTTMTTTTATAPPMLKRPSVQIGGSGAAASPKIPKNKLPVIQPPTYYGCEHIGRMFQHDSDTAKQSRQFYSSATRVALDAERLAVQTCARCSYILRRTYLCLQCPAAHCFGDAEGHARDTGHMFGVDSRNGHVYCFHCQDYIYDPTLEEIRIAQETAGDGGGVRKKRRLSDARLAPEDIKLIEANTSAAPCRATGLRGFLNMGSTCFMSVVLQSLIHNPLVRNFYLADGHKQKECALQDCMSCAMDEVFSEFFTSPAVDGFGPVNLLTTSWKCEQTLAGYQQQDAHEYLQFLLNQLHTTNAASTTASTAEASSSTTSSATTSATTSSTTDASPPDCKCIIHRSFYGKLQSDVTCESCRNVTTAFDPVMDLSLDLRIKDRKKAEARGAVVQSLQQCLARFTTTERLGVNEYNCGKCAGPREATKQLTVKQLPPVLCVQLKRFEHSASGSSKIEGHISFPMHLDMTPYTGRARRKPAAASAEDPQPAARSSKPFKYDLLSVVVHKGEINSGHYISYARHGGQWFQFDDSMVTLATEKQVLATQAYLLFYITRTL
ncbi:hypothetical protein EDC01DRAFT_639370, partial [Geopyxis carbonaria]